MKFLADMGISPRTVEFLLGLGHEVVHLHAEGLDRWPDAAILEKAAREGRVVLTADLDFGALLAISGATLPSVVIFRLRDMRPTNVNWYLREIVDHHLNALEAGAVISVDEGHIRVRSLPIMQ